MVGIFDSPEKQKKLCNFLRMACLLSTGFIMLYITIGFWAESFFPKATNYKIFVTYLTLLIGSYIVQRIFIEGHPAEPGAVDPVDVKDGGGE